MAFTDKTKREARNAYVADRVSLDAISSALDVPKTTLTRWRRDAKKAGDDWDKHRGANVLAGEGVQAIVAATLEDFILLYQETLEELKADKSISALDKAAAISKLADAFNKTISSAGRASPELSKLGIAMDIIAKLADFTHKNFAECGEALLTVLEPFGDYLAKNYK
jgi:transposase-like protein